MERQPGNRLATFVLITYNQEKYVREAILGAFSQTYTPLEIVISDDCSKDATFEIIQDLTRSYTGPHTIVLNRNGHNLGIAGNINKAFELASGEFLIAAAGDDISVPDRTASLMDRYVSESLPAVDLVCSYFEEIDEKGISTGNIEKNVARFRNLDQSVHKWQCETVGACNGYSRKLYDKYGALSTGIIAEDWAYFFRAWLESGAAIIERPLVLRRIHEESVMRVHAELARRDSDTRRKLRRKSRESGLALGKQWLTDYHLSGKHLEEKSVVEFKRWIALMEMEKLADDSTRTKALGLSLAVLARFGDLRRAARIMLRSVLRVA